MSFSPNDYDELLDRLIGCGVAFACFFYPGSELPVLIVEDGEPEVLSSLSDVDGRDGFVFAPFSDRSDFPILFFTSQKRVEGFSVPLVLGVNPNNDTAESSEVSTAKEEYLTAFKRFMVELADGGLSKLVLSRKHVVENRSRSVGSMFLKAHNRYPSAFTYLVNAPKCGLWFGATPELLLKGKSSAYETVALAGTMPVSDGESCYKWLDKDKEEQQMVVDYIHRCLTENGVSDITVDGPDTVQAGSVVHLKSRFSFEKPEKLSIGNLLESLHPTPAVCGTPKDAALKLILESEPHDRSYYSGFVGMVDEAHETNLYVNLRCMKITRNQMVLFAGGGITSKSDGEKEWQETAHKLRTMLAIIED